jgi:hypothetical protein
MLVLAYLVLLYVLFLRYMPAADAGTVSHGKEDESEAP